MSGTTVTKHVPGPAPASAARRRAARSWLALVLAGCVGLAAALMAGESAFSRGPAPPAPGLVAGSGQAAVGLDDLEQEVKGFLEPLRRTIIGAPTYGRISEVLVEEGDRVEEGDILVQLDDRRRKLELDLAQFDAENTAELKHAEVSSRYRLTAYQRQKQYYDQAETPFITKSDLEGYQLQSDLAAALVRLRETELARRQTLRDLSDYDLENTRIRAPFAGTVGRKVAEVGQVAELGTQLLELIDTHQLYFVIKTFPASRLRELAVGQEVLVTPEVFPEYERRGRIVLVGPEVDQASGFVRVKVLVENPDGKLLAGLCARATFLPDQTATAEGRAATTPGERK